MAKYITTPITLYGDVLIKQIDGMFSGRERVQSAVATLCPFIGLAESQGHHTNQAYYKSGIMPPECQVWKRTTTGDNCSKIRMTIVPGKTPAKLATP